MPTKFVAVNCGILQHWRVGGPTAWGVQSILCARE